MRIATCHCDSLSVLEWATRLLIGFLIYFFAASPLLAQIVVDTFAGGKIRSGIPAQDAALSSINGLTWDANGNLVICEGSTNVIRRIRPDGIIETVAGNGTAGFSGDGGAALKAALNRPSSPRFDSEGNLYFADTYNNRIRKIDAQGVIATVAGNGVPLVTGMALEGSSLGLSLGAIIDLAVDRDGNIYVTESDSDVIRRVIKDGLIEVFAGVPHPDCHYCADGDDGPARLAKIAKPGLMTFDGAGSLYVVERESRIRRIALDGTISGFAGYGDSITDDDGKPALDVLLYRVPGIGTDAEGQVYIIQSQLPSYRTPPTRIRRIDLNGMITTIAGGQGGQRSPDGPALPSSLSPLWLAVDGSGNVAFADLSGSWPAQVVRVVTAQETLKTIAGGHPKPAPDGTRARDAWFLNPAALAFDSKGNLHIAESDACLIRKIDANGVLSTAAGTGRCGESAPYRPNTTQDLAPPVSIAFDSKDRLYMMDISGNSYVITGGEVTPVQFPPVLGFRGKLAIDSKDRVYLLDIHSLVRITPDGKQETVVSPPPGPGVPPVGFGPIPGSIGVDPFRNVYFTGYYLGPGASDYVFRVNDDGTFQPLYGGASNRLTLTSSSSLAVDSIGSVWLAGGAIEVVTASGQSALGSQGPGGIESGPAQSARFSASAITLGPQGDLYVIDSNRIRRLIGSGPPQAPVIAAGGIVNAASYVGGAIAPGELVSIFGSYFGTPGVQVNSPENSRIPWVLGRTKVLFDNLPGAITAIAPNQINVFVPYWIEAGKSVNVVVQVDGTASTPVSVPVAKASPGLSTADQSGSGQGAILNQDGSLNSSANPAPRGSIVSFFGTGEGQVFPRLLWGDLSLSAPFPAPTEPVAVTIGEQPAEVTYAGAAPLQPVGVFQLNARIPVGAVPGNVPVSVAVGGIGTSKKVTVAVR